MTTPKRDLGYVNLLGEYVKLSLERDGLRFELSQSKASAHGRDQQNNRMLEILGAELRGDERYYLTWHDRGQQQSAVIRDIRALRAGESLKPAILPPEAAP